MTTESLQLQTLEESLCWLVDLPGWHRSAGPSSFASSAREIESTGVNKSWHPHIRLTVGFADCILQQSLKAVRFETDIHFSGKFVSVNEGSGTDKPVGAGIELRLLRITSVAAGTNHFRFPPTVVKIIRTATSLFGFSSVRGCVCRFASIFGLTSRRGEVVLAVI